MKKNFLSKKYINKIKKNINNIMNNFVKYKKKNNSELFNLISKKSNKLRGNLYKCFSKFTSCTEILSDKKLKKYLINQGFKNPILHSYSIIVMEPNKKKYLFPLHQDLKHRISKKSILMWIPLNDNINGKLGGIEVFKNSQKSGPLPHEIGESGLMQLKKRYLNKVKKLVSYKVDNFRVGDIFFMSPYLCHRSILNLDEKDSRWTLIIQIDDITKPHHLKNSLHPFDIDKFTLNLSNDKLRKINKIN